MLENVRGLSQPRFAAYRSELIAELEDMGYVVFWELITAADYGLAQLRPRFILVALKERFCDFFAWPTPVEHSLTVGEALRDLMAEGGWPGAAKWAERARGIGPTLVGGSKKHGGPDLGPTRAREAWARLGVKGSSIAEEAPGPDFPVDPNVEMPRLTVRMGGVLQGFPADWEWQGGKTAAWKQVGNAFPPPVAQAVGQSIAAALSREDIPTGSIPAAPAHPDQALLKA